MSPQESGYEFAEVSVVSAENPWPGLESFREADQGWFQGRRVETAELLQHVKRERLMVLFALSGIGKSSLLQAGLFPALRRDNIFPVYVRLDHTAEIPNLRGQVFDAVAQAGFACDVKTPTARSGATLWEYFHRVDAEFWGRNQRRVLPLLVFDQFEEIFTLGRTGARTTPSEDFLDELADLVDGTPPASVTARWAANPADRDEYLEEGEYKLLLSLRGDFLDQLYDQRRRIAAVPQKRYGLFQMTGEGGLLAVSQAKELVDEAVATQIVRYVAAGDRLGGGRGASLAELRIEPALLSVVCHELNLRRRELGERKISANLLTENRERVLSDFYSRGLSGMPASVRKFIEEELITVAGRRNQVPLENAQDKGMTPDIVEKLVERRLLRKEPTKTGFRIELTHDLLTEVVAASRIARRNEEAVEKQRIEREENRKKLRRSTLLMTAFAGIASLALVAAVVAAQQRGTARERAAEAVRQTDIALRETKIAEEKTELANQKTKDALAAMDQATREKYLKDEQARIAQENEARAKANEAQALQERQKALEADKNKDIALQKALAAEKDRAAAAAQSEIDRKKAEIEAANAKASQAAEAEANKKTDEKNKQLQRENANQLVVDASGLVSTGQVAQIQRALGDLARSLYLEPNSMAAKSLAFDQLIRGKWRADVDPSQSGARQFVHPALAHPNGVLFATFSPDGRVATVGRDQKVRFWDWQAGSATQFAAQLNTPVALAFSPPDGRRVAIASYDLNVPVWESSGQGQPVILTGHTQRITSVAFSRDDKWIVTASQDLTARVWDAATGKPAGAPLRHPATVNSAAFSPDGARIVTSSANSVYVWNWSTGAQVFQMPQSKEIWSAAFSPNGEKLITTSADNTARIWSAQSASAITGALQHNGPVYYAAFSPDGQRVVTASADKTARVWDAATGNPITGPLAHTGTVRSASFSSDGRRVVTASDDRTAQVWEVWHDFESVPDLVSLLEYVSGTDASKADMPQISSADKTKLQSDLQAKANQQPATGFLRWFFAHRQ